MGSLASGLPLLARVAPTAALVAGAGAMAWREHGSIVLADVAPYALGAALVLATVLVSGAGVRPGRLPLAAIAALAALAGWAATSLTWSPAPALARDEALLTAFYAVAFAVPLLTLRGGAERRAATALVAAGSVVLALATALTLALSERRLALYDAGRLDFPISYYNGQAAVFAVAFWPLIALAARRSPPVLLRGFALGGAVAVLAASLLAQSKGSVAALAVSGAVLLAVSRQRLRALVPALFAAAFVALAFPPLTAPFRAEENGALRDAIGAAGRVVLVLALAGAATGVLYALLDRRFELPARLHRLAGALAVAGLLGGAATGAGGFFLAVERPGGFLKEKWNAFKALPAEEQASTHLVSLGSNRYDFWRVAAGEFREHPVAGIGARGYGSAYLEQRRSVETPARAHSLPLDVMSELGAVGLVLLVAALALPLLVLLRRARGELVSAGVLGACIYWLVHSSVDWIWTLPAAGLPFFCLLGIGASGTAARRLRDRAAVPAGVAVAAAALLAFTPPWLAARLSEHALRQDDRTAPALEWAQRLDPLSVDPLVAEAALAASASARIDPLERAVEREPRSVAVRYLLGVAYLDAGRTRAARRELRLAKKLDPRGDLIGRALARARQGRQ